MSWLILLIAGLLEVMWATGLKQWAAAPSPSIMVRTIVSMVLSLGLLGFAMRNIPLGTAYAVWTGVGTLGSALIGILYFQEPATAVRLFCLALILCGIVGLKIS